MRLSNASYYYFGLFLSRAMARLGHLGTLYTNLPWTRLRDLPPGSWRSQPLFAAPKAFHRLGMNRLGARVEPFAARLFSRWVGASLTECDVFHSFSGTGLEAFQAARSKFGAMTVVERGSTHIRFQIDLLLEEYRRWGQPFAWFDRRIIEREESEYAMCDRITVQSTFAERTFLERGIPKEKLIKLPLAADLRMFRPAPKADSVFRVLYAGHGSIRKGVPYLLEAISKLKLPNFELVINGSVGDEMKGIMARHSGSYRFLGFQPLAKLHEVYSQASVLVLPTIEDGFAKVVPEAMACGVPVIATTNCGASDVLDDGVQGFIVPIRDPEAIRDKIVYLYENPGTRQAMADAALKRAQTVANWDSYGPRAATAYQQALAEVRGAARQAHG